MKRNRLFLRITTLFLSLLLLAGCGEAPQEQTRGNTGSVYTNGAYDDFKPGSISNKHTLSFINNASAQTQKKKHTVLIYIVGSNLESNGGYASKDIREMLGSDFDAESNNLLIYAGGSKSWNLNISSAQNWLLRLKPDGIFHAEAASQEAANMGNARVLADFLNFAYKNYPAEKYSLIFWDHGGGPLFGFGSDEQFSDSLYLHELQWAMENSPFKKQKLEMVGFDACLMATLEIASIFAPYAKYLIASEELEPGSGWDYDFLGVYNSDMPTTVVAQRILNEYKGSLKASTKYTLSCMDLSKLDKAVAAADKLFLKMAEGCLTGEYATIARLRDKTKRFAVSSSPYDLVDLGHMAKQLKSLYGTQAAALESALKELVPYQVSNMDNTSGVSIYYPYDSQERFTKYGEKISGAVLNSQGYQLFIKAFASKWIKGRPQLSWNSIKPQVSSTEPPATNPPATNPPATNPPATNPPATNPPATNPPATNPPATNPPATEPPADIPSAEENYLTWQIDPAYINVYSSASYTILRYDSDTDTYTPVLSDCQALIDENGTIYVPQDPYIFTVTTDGTPTSIVWPAIQGESLNSQSTYYSHSTLLASGDVVIGSAKAVEVILGENAQGELYLERVLTRNEDASLFGKSDVELSQWSSLGILKYQYYVTKDTDGNILPAEKWSTDGALTVEYVPYTSWLHFQKERLSKQDGEYYLELSLTDVQGNSYNVAYHQLQAAETYTAYEYPTAAGTLCYRVYDDHAELVSFKESEFDRFAGDEPLTITLPNMIGRKPVTVICSEVFKGCYSLGSVQLNSTLRRIEQGAFRACYNLKQVKAYNGLTYIGEEAFYASPLEAIALPETVTAIGWRAFAGTKLTFVTLPASLTHLGSGAFYGCQKLTGILVAPGNAKYTSMDGVLFSADRLTLLAYPAGKGTSYSVPEGTQVIAAEAFRDCPMLTDLRLPNGLKKIAPLAFCDTLNLERVGLPGTLESIGSAAFGKSLGAERTHTLSRITLGENLTWIGEGAFDGYYFSGFYVTKGNTAFSSDGAYLMNTSGSRLIRVPTQLQGVARIPNTVNHIEAGAFTDCTGLTEILLPDSVTSIAELADIPSTVTRLTIGKGLLNWNNLKYCASIASLGIPAGNPNFKVVDGNLYNGDVTELLLFRSKQTACTLPNTVVRIASGAFRAGKTLPLQQLTLPASLEAMPDGAFGQCAALESILVATGNAHYSSYDGLLYNADGTVLIAIPMGKAGTVQVKPGTLEVARGAIYDSSLLQAEEILLPEGLLAIRDSNLMSSGNASVLTVKLPASLTDIHTDFLKYFWSSSVRVITPAGSYAAQYAQSKGISVTIK